MQGDPGDADSHFAYGREQVLVEMQPGGGRRRRAAFTGIDRLVAQFVGRCRLALDIRRQRQAAMALEEPGRIAGKPQAVELAGAPQDFDIEGVFEPQSTAGLRRLAGSHLGQDLAAVEQPFNEYFDLPPTVLVPQQAGMQDPAVIHHQQVATAQPSRQIDKHGIAAAVAVQYQQATGRSLRQGRLGDQLRRQCVIEIGEGQGHQDGGKLTAK